MTDSTAPTTASETFVPDPAIVTEYLGRMNLTDMDATKALLAEARAAYDAADSIARSTKYVHDMIATLLTNLGTTDVVKIAKPRGPKASKA